MAWKCNTCNHYTADGDKHDCINDRYKRALEVIEFYADINNYENDGDICRPTGNKVYDILLNDFERGNKKDYAGRRAREFFKSLK